jgi:hypothetical protein
MEGPLHLAGRSAVLHHVAGDLDHRGLELHQGLPVELGVLPADVLEEVVEQVQLSGTESPSSR